MNNKDKEYVYELIEKFDGLYDDLETFEENFVDIDNQIEFSDLILAEEYIDRYDVYKQLYIYRKLCYKQHLSINNLSQQSKFRKLSMKHLLEIIFTNKDLKQCFSDMSDSDFSRFLPNEEEGFGDIFDDIDDEI
jgi:hypothetical protein